jgi:hypothetical protein
MGSKLGFVGICGQCLDVCVVDSVVDQLPALYVPFIFFHDIVSKRDGCNSILYEDWGL